MAAPPLVENDVNGTNGVKEHGTRYRRVNSQPGNPFASLIPDQDIAIVPEFELESGVVLRNVPVAYKAYGKLSPAADNCMVICHALTGSADVSDWWGPMLGGPGKAFDMTRFFVICLNSLGSPYGSGSPVTYKDGDSKNDLYGPEFPLTTIRDDVNLFKLVLDDLGVKQIATVIGGSMGGMLVLEFAYFGKDYVRTIIPIATSARYSAWGISWGEAQRQSIYSDPKYEDGYYSFKDPPSTGLGAARMAALLTYRSRDSFESRFGRNIPDTRRRQSINGPQHLRASSGNEHFAIHNDGHKNAGSPRSSRPGTSSSAIAEDLDATLKTIASPKKRTPTYFSTQSYLRYQGDKFIKRFDANCYIAITRKLDTHDVSRNRISLDVESAEEALKIALSQIEQPTLVLGIQSDGLFAFSEQVQLNAGIPNSRLERIESSEGHDAFLLEFEQVNNHLLKFMKEELADIFTRTPTAAEEANGGDEVGKTKSSTFGEAEVDDITAW
ncbi:homoserine o-acetyltransferase [Rhizodiscina lignyota]|uniref:Homoserine o-acetyltransferase n=1 Tax=Rhizodiscina lignyota TaxID=1504668 RepID=A0A9P4IM60_9PEZI|nr:homoserine o-acetyltransferase [Rhizodiscina lignyota]